MWLGGVRVQGRRYARLQAGRQCAGWTLRMLTIWLSLLPVLLHASEEEPSPASVPLSAPVGPDVAIAVEVPPPAVADGVLEATDKGCIRRDDSGQFMGWMDYQQCVFSGQTVDAARWFDDLFGDWSDDEAGALVRVISEVGWDEENGWSTEARVRARVDLPNASRRMRLIISDDGEDAQTQEQRTSPQALKDIRDNASVSVRWNPLNLARIDSDMDIGLRSGPDIFARLRLRRLWTLTENSVVRAGQTFRYGTESLGVSTSQLDFQRAMSEQAVLSLNTVFQFDQTQDEDGFVWTHGLAMSHVLKNKGSLAYGISLSGHTKPNYSKESYGPWMLWRQSFLRDWLYYEVEPRLTSYRDVEWDVVPSVVLRLEVHLGRRKKVKEPVSGK